MFNSDNLGDNILDVAQNAYFSILKDRILNIKNELYILANYPALNAQAENYLKQLNNIQKLIEDNNNNSQDIINKIPLIETQLIQITSFINQSKKDIKDYNLQMSFLPMPKAIIDFETSTGIPSWMIIFAAFGILFLIMRKKGK